MISKLFRKLPKAARPNRINSSKNFITRYINTTSIPKYDPTSLNIVENLPETQMTTLSNGLRVVTEPNLHNKHSATVGVWIASGSRYEQNFNNGSAHFLEHLAFKGTTKRTQYQLEKEIENIGGHLNAYTSREQTTYFASVMKKDIPQAVDILADILFHSKMSPQSIENERGTILTEMKEVYKDMDEYIFDRLHESAYLSNSLGFTILGKEQNIKTITREILLDYLRKHHTPDRMVLVGTGAVDHQSLVKLAQEKFGQIPSGDPKNAPKAEPGLYTGGEYREREDDLGLTHVAIAYETCGWTDPDTFPLLFMHALLGSWDVSQPNGEHSSSRLVATMASYRYGEKLMPFNTIYNDTGLFGIYATLYEARTLDGMKIILHALSDLSSAVNETQVAEVRNSLITAAFAGTESSSQAFEEVGRQVLTYGRKIPAREFLARLNAVDAAAIRSAASRFLYDKDHSMATIGPILEMPPTEWIRKKSFSVYR